ncbi:enoyl-CoA hydratase/isomerase family protein [Paraburkholderia silviterrae]|uniref:Enoyl-CoA hydratase/isomerase family protein n=1 Tax=Paraburkholderia silviterrae TaxID=2528715 RepID=A0A4R5M0U7_9BURK|nr:enoyl-CoA hydratase/isomerase family protein [Paraburkholderia silviterrae]TDG18856.1 enoyl-CoA hydratase/isomerase family protein [Paraburkholderia silviterrae]
MNTTASQFKLTKVSPSYWRLTFDNPPINMIDPQSMLELQDLVTQFESDPELKVVVFDSADPEFFVAHFDISRAAETPKTPGPTGYSPWIDFTLRLAKAPVISIAAVRGRARGIGSEFALACDLRFGSLEKAIFSQVEVGSGLIPGGGGMERLPLLTGRARALEIIAGSADFDAATAERYGWINRSIPDVEFDAWIDNFARRVASFDKQALSTTKELLNRHTLPAPDELLDTARAFLTAFSWPGFRERAPKLSANGIGQRGDFELNFGERVGKL